MSKPHSFQLCLTLQQKFGGKESVLPKVKSQADFALGKERVKLGELMAAYELQHDHSLVDGGVHLGK